MIYLSKLVVATWVLVIFVMGATANDCAISEESWKKLEGLLNLPSASGSEDKAQAYWLDCVKGGADEVGGDDLKNAWAVFKSKRENAVDLLIDAHVDEVGYRISEITPEGMIKVEGVGFPDAIGTLGAEYVFFGAKGEVKAISGRRPSWWRTKRESIPMPDEVLFDVGAANDAEVRELGLKVGDVGVPATKPKLINGKRLVAHGLDCRLNVYVLMELAKFLAANKDKIYYNVTLLSSTQEEVGLVGCYAYCEKKKPKQAIVLDCVIDTVPNLYEKSRGNTGAHLVMGQGPVLYTHPNFFSTRISNELKQVAKNINLKCQEDTDPPPGLANFLPVKYFGGEAGFVGPAIRYMHSPRELADMKDVQGIISLLKAYLITPPDSLNSAEKK